VWGSKWFSSDSAATPPNAIAYGTGEINSWQMLRVGVVLDLLAIPIVYVIAMTAGSFILTP